MNYDAAVILVAGVGTRLRPLTVDRPKALVQVGERTIMLRAIELLLARGIREIVLATGYREDQIRKAVAEVPARVTLCPNPDYASTQNSVSLGLCRPALVGKSFLKLDGDLVFDPRVLDRLLAADAELAVAVDSRRELDAEAMKIRINSAGIAAFGKALPVSEAHAETLGIEGLSARAAGLVFDAIDDAVARGQRDLYYEDVYSSLIASGQLHAQAVEAGDLEWSEVDDHDDLERARSVASRC